MSGERVLIYDCDSISPYDPDHWPCTAIWEIDADISERDAIAEQWLAIRTNLSERGGE